MSGVNISICDGKYTVIQAPTGTTRVLRYGEEWRDVTGDNVIGGLAWELQEARDRIKQLEELYEGEIGERPEFLGSNLKGLLIRELNLANNRIKQLEKALEASAMIIGPPGHSEWATDDEINRAWGLYIQTKEIKP